MEISNGSQRVPTLNSMGCSYTDFIRLNSLQNPCLIGLSLHMECAPKVPSTIRLLEYDVDGKVFHGRAQVDHKNLSLLFERPAPGPISGRILLIENLRPDVISCLAQHLDVDPMFFAEYITTDYKGIDKAPPPPALAFSPSQILQRNHIHIHYQQVIDLGNTTRNQKSLEYAIRTRRNVPRNIRRLPPLSGRQLGRQLALIRTCCSVLVKRLGSTWYTIILTDPPVSELVKELGEEKTYQATALQGGFEDFQRLRNEKWDKTSMLTSLLHYFRTHPPGFNPSNPTTLCFAYFPLRIALAEWVLYIHLISRYQKYYEYSLQNIHERPLESDIVDLQRWRRRITQSHQKVKVLSQIITHRRKEEDRTEQQTWDMMLLDIDSILSKLEHYGHSMEQVVPVATGMVLLLDARESARQAANITMLTYIALIFVPLSWATGLFSMSDSFLPGGEKFWVYISTAFPLAIAILVISVVPLGQIVMVVGGYLKGLLRSSPRRFTESNIEQGL